MNFKAALALKEEQEGDLMYPVLLRENEENF